MKHTRTSWAVAALFLSLAGCGSSEGKERPATPPPPAAPVAKNERTPVPPAKLEDPPPAPAPKPIADPAPPPEPPPKPVLDPPKPPEPAPVPAPDPKPDPAPKPADVSVTGFETGGTLEPDGHVSDPKTVFAPADTVHLAVLADGAARAVRIGVSWMGPDGVRIREDVQDPTLGEPKAVPFELLNAAGLAPGKYKAEIRIEGWLASTAEFEVR